MDSYQPPSLTEEKRKSLIFNCENEIEQLIADINRCDAIGNSEFLTFLQSQLERQQIALASLEAKPFGWLRVVSGKSFQILEQQDRPHDRSGNGAGPWFAVYSSQPSPTMKPIELPNFDGYLPHIVEELQAAFTQAVVRAGYEVKRHNEVANGQ